MSKYSETRSAARAAGRMNKHRKKMKQMGESAQKQIEYENSLFSWDSVTDPNYRKPRYTRRDKIIRWIVTIVILGIIVSSIVFGLAYMLDLVGGTL